MKSKNDREDQKSRARTGSDDRATTAGQASKDEQPYASDTRSAGTENQNSAKELQFRKRITILSLVFSGLLLVATSVYAYFAWGQWTAMDDSLTEIRKNRELEYRAYIGARGANFAVRPDNPAWGNVTLVTINTGRTAIRGAAVLKRVLKWQDAPPPDDAVVTEQPISSRIGYIPNIEYPTLMGQIPTSMADVLQAQNTLGVNSGPTPTPRVPPKATPVPTPLGSLTPPKGFDFGPGYYLYGVIEYKDVFEKSHWTKFCFYIAPGSSAFTYCPTFNDSN